MTEKIYRKKVLIAIRVRKFPKGTTPHTDPSEFLGLLSLKYPKGSFFKPHTHKPIKRESRHLQECFIVRRGKVRVDLYDTDKKFFKKLYLKAGDALVTLRGGHAFTVLEDAEIFETKNGPYKEDKVFI